MTWPWAAHALFVTIVVFLFQHRKEAGLVDIHIVMLQGLSNPTKQPKADQVQLIEFYL